jgi:hypothetical protein
VATRLGATRLALIGWGVVVLVAILMLVLRGSAEAGPAIVFAVVALAVGAWLWFRNTRASWVTSLVLGVLWLLQFAAYAIADLVDDEFDVALFLVDLVAVAGGIAIVAGAIHALRERRRAAAAGEPVTTQIR